MTDCRRQPGPAPLPIPGGRALASRACVGFVLLLVALQALLLPAQRTAQRAHFHLANSSTQVRDAVAADALIDPRILATLRPGHDHHGAAHSHSQLGFHQHDPSSDVVYVDADDTRSVAGSTPVLGRAALDIDAVWARDLIEIIALPTVVPIVEATQPFRSRIEPVPERPPRARA